MKNPEEIVKCRCGLPMRAKNWANHWAGCYLAGRATVDEQDRRDLEAYGARRRVRDAERQPAPPI